MTQGERVRMIRKHPNVNLTLEKFGEKLGIKKSALSLIENGKNNLTEQMASDLPSKLLLAHQRKRRAFH